MDLDAQQRRHTPRASSVEYVDFAGVDEIDKTLKSGFDSLIGINDQILVQLKKGIITEGYETPAPAVRLACIGSGHYPRVGNLWAHLSD